MKKKYDFLAGNERLGMVRIEDMSAEFMSVTALKDIVENNFQYFGGEVVHFRASVGQIVASVTLGTICNEESLRNALDRIKNPRPYDDAQRAFNF